MIPNFDNNGSLPVGIHVADSWEEIEAKLGFSPRRKQLLIGLKLALNFLKILGCKIVYIDGSFATSKERPGDYDMCWEEAGVDLKKLKQNYPVLMDFSNRREKQKTMFGGEIFPATNVAEPVKKTIYKEYFQKDKDNNPKGIIQYNL